MRITIRTAEDTTLSALAARLYTVDEPGRAAVEQALLAANGDYLADLARVPLGAAILVPAVAGVAFTPDLTDPAEPRAARLDPLGRSVADVTARVYDDHAAALADLDRSEEETFAQVRTGPLPRDGKPSRDRLLAARDGVHARLRPLRDDVQRLRTILGAPAIVRPAPALQLRRFTLTGPEQGSVGQSRLRLHVPPAFKILGGGARVVTSPTFFSEGVPVVSVLTTSRPEGLHTWHVHGKAHLRGTAIQLTAEVVALFDPEDDFEVVVAESVSPVVPHPSGTVSLPPGFVLTGGGAQSLYRGDGNLLTSSHPIDGSTWFAAAKDHVNSDPAALAIFAIGLRSRRGAPLDVRLTEATGPEGAQPAAFVAPAEGRVTVGGGAHINFRSPGVLLTASTFSEQGWRAEGSAHIAPDTGDATAYALGLADATLLPDA